MKKILTVVLALTLLTVSTLALPVGVMASTARDDILNSVNESDPGSTNVDTAVGTGITLFTTVVGIAAVIMMLVGGYKYITSGGDPNKAASAKNTIVYALIGVALVALAQVILRFTIGKSRSL